MKRAQHHIRLLLLQAITRKALPLRSLQSENPPGPRLSRDAICEAWQGSSHLALSRRMADCRKGVGLR